MAPRPLLIFQKISPSVSPWTRADVQSAGLGGGSAAAAGPSPLPDVPWQVTQFVSTVFLALPTPLTVFFAAATHFGSAFHSPCAQVRPAAAPATSAVDAATTTADFRTGCMWPPLR